MAGTRQAFQSNPELQEFIIPDVRLTGKQLGAGSYGSVEELEMDGMVCAGKRIHDALVEQGNAGVANIMRKYLQECQVMAKMRHPHIVQFLGLCFIEGSALPVLVMERLDSSLDDLLEGTPSLPLALKQSLLIDVARGLLYLHTRNPPIVHRDLSARNVLLTSSLVAKISDLGNARLVNLQPGQLARTLTHLPGTTVYMAPEAFDEGSRYGPQLDIFSFGHLTLFTLTQVFPGSLLPHNHADPQNPDRLLGRSEVERRRDYIQQLHGQLGEEHSLVQLVHQCLHNTPTQRPSAEELLQQLEAMRVQIEGPYGSQLKKMDIAKVGMMKAVREIESLQKQVQQLVETEQTAGRETEIRAVQLQEKDAEIERQQRELQTLRVEMEAKETQLQQKDDHIQHLDIQLQQKDAQLQRQGTELRDRGLQLNRQRTELRTLKEDQGRLQTEMEAKLAEKDAEIDIQQRELQTLRVQITAEDEKLDEVQSQLQQLQEEVDARSAQLQQQLQERDAEINRLQQELKDQATSRDETASDRSQNLQSHSPTGLKLKWRRLADMPEAMWFPQSVIVDTVVYMREGGVFSSGIIHRYDAQIQQWTQLPEYHNWNFAMTEVNFQLTLVGGMDATTFKTSNAVAVYSTLHGWEQPYPPMKTPRIDPAVCRYHQHLVVAGGSDGLSDLAAVEILDTSTRHSQWLSTTPLPVSCSRLSPVIIQDTLYLLGGTGGRQVLSVSLSALTHTDMPPPQWYTLPDAPLENSAAISLHGSLLTVGGSHDDQRSSAIHVYQEEKNSWMKLGDLPTVRSSCTCCLLPNGEILVAGGEDHKDWTSQMDVAAIDELL